MRVNVSNDKLKEKFQTLKEHTRFAPPNSRIFLERVSTKVLEIIMKFQILNFKHFFFFFWGGGGSHGSQWRNGWP